MTHCWIDLSELPNLLVGHHGPSPPAAYPRPVSMVDRFKVDITCLCSNVSEEGLGDSLGGGEATSDLSACPCDSRSVSRVANYGSQLVHLLRQFMVSVCC